MDYVEKMGKTVEEAIIEALKELGATYEEVDIEVVDTGSKGLFGIGKKDAKVQVRKKYDPKGSASNFLNKVFTEMGLEVTLEIKMPDAKQMEINLVGQDMGILIGKRGQTLDSLQYLVNLVVNKDKTTYCSVTLDTENYRQRRKETLESLAHNLAKKVKATKKSVVLEPMNPYERRIIHAALQNDKQITTYSEGDEPYRNVIIALK